MPRATISKGKSEKKDLTTCEGGFVELRRMSYREFLKRRDMASGMSFRGGNQGKGKSKEEMEARLDAANETVTKYEFEKCIVKHNLEDDNGTTLNFASESAFNLLDPRIGEEISDLIDKMNQFNPTDEDEDEDGEEGGTPNLSEVSKMPSSSGE